MSRQLRLALESQQWVGAFPIDSPLTAWSLGRAAGVRKELLERTRERIDLVVVIPEGERADLVEEGPGPRRAAES